MLSREWSKPPVMEFAEMFLRIRPVRPELFVVRWVDIYPNRRPPEEVFPVEEAKPE
jgi:hypothetical protein